MLLDIDECSNGSHDCDVNANFRIAVFITRLMIKRQRNDFHAPISYFYYVAGLIVQIKRYILQVP